jgi:NAD(P)-dependent dehydrogenase (short-subunit alcohol dehydrogenase family)
MMSPATVIAVSGSLTGNRVLVVGASSGIGAALARAVAARGGSVTVSARRRERLDALVEEMGTGHAAAGDATVPGDARRVAREAVAAMGGLDLMVYVAGYGVLQPLDRTEPDTWSDVYRVNVVGANLAAAAALEHMDRGGLIAFVSSRTVEDANALFASYSASKAALDQCIRVWRAEHPERRFMRVVMGNTAGTEFSDHMNLDLLGEALDAWERQALPGGLMDVDEVGSALAEALAVVLSHPEIDFGELKLDARTA